MLQSQDFNDRYGTLTETLNPHSRVVGTFWTVLILVRWHVTIVILVILRDYSGFQILMLLYVSAIAQTCIIVGKPYLLERDNKMALFNEAMVSIYLYVLMGLTDFNLTIYYRDLLGWILLATVFTSILVNIGKVVVVMGTLLNIACRKLVFRIKRYISQRNHQKKYIIDDHIKELPSSDITVLGDQSISMISEYQQRRNSIISESTSLFRSPNNSIKSQRKSSVLRRPSQIIKSAVSQNTDIQNYFENIPKEQQITKHQPNALNQQMQYSTQSDVTQMNPQDELGVEFYRKYNLNPYGARMQSKEKRERSVNNVGNDDQPRISVLNPTGRAILKKEISKPDS